MVVDTLIKNARVVGPEGTYSGAVAVKDGKIASIHTDAALPEAGRVIDAGGNHLIPGVVDAHVHYGVYHSFEEEVHDLTCAVYGGTTTVCAFVGLGASAEKGSYSGVVEKWVDCWEKNAHLDIVFHGGMCSETNIDEVVANAGKYGITTYKFLMTCKGEEAKLIGGDVCDDGFLFDGFKSIARLGDKGLAMLHAEDYDVITRILPGVKEAGGQDLAAWAAARPEYVETLDVIRAIAIGKVTGCPLYFVHIHNPASLEAIAQAQLEGQTVFAETCPQYLVLNSESDIPGPLGKINPPLRSKEANDGLWDGINEGLISCVGSDHCSTTRAMAPDLWAAPPGSPGVENLLPVMLSEGVNKGRITIEKLVEVLCANNARVFDIYPQKGVIQPGSDADLVIVDLEKKGRFGAAEQHYRISDYTPYEGWEVTGWPVMTMVRGMVVVEDGELKAEAGLGRYVPRAFKA